MARATDDCGLDAGLDAGLDDTVETPEIRAVDWTRGPRTMPTPSHTAPCPTGPEELTALTERTNTVRCSRVAGRSAIRTAMRRGLANARWGSRRVRGSSLRRVLDKAGQEPVD